MRYHHQMAHDEWRLYEVELVSGKQPFSDALERATEADLKKIVRQLRLLQAGGPPPPKGDIRPTTSLFEKFQELGVTVYVLKAKPGPWRIFYFRHPDQEGALVIFYAIVKKKNRYPLSVKKKCQNIVEQVVKHECTFLKIEIPL